MDWSDAQLAGLKDVVGDEVASSITKGCQVASTVFCVTIYITINVFVSSCRFIV